MSCITWPLGRVPCPSPPSSDPAHLASGSACSNSSQRAGQCCVMFWIL